MTELNKKDIEIIAKATGYDEVEIRYYDDKNLGRVFKSFQELVRWYFSEDEKYAVDLIIEWFIDDNKDVIVKPKEFLKEGLSAIELTEGKFAYFYE